MVQKSSIQESKSFARINLLRSVYDFLRKEGFAGFIVPKTDAHRSEYCYERDNLVQFLTGFSGSSGFVALSLDISSDINKAAIFVDGRYTLQVKNEVDPDLFYCEDYKLNVIEKWLSKGLKVGDKIAYDPLLLSKKEHEQFKDCFKKYGILLEALPLNPLELLWKDRPPLDISNIVPHPLEYTGVSFEEKISLIRALMVERKVDGFFLNYSESIAWIFNIRAPKRIVTPAAPIYAYVPAQGECSLFIHSSQLTKSLEIYFKGQVSLKKYEDVFDVIAQRSAEKSIAIDCSNATMKMFFAIEAKGGKAIALDDFCDIPRACKNETELKGARQAHIRDGVAVSNCLAWLEGAINYEKITELDVVKKIYQYRQQQNLFQGHSFDTISGAGPNGAIVHYRVDEKSNRTLQQNDIFLLDSGGQYLDGTTDITRTISLNKSPTPEQKDRYTRVLKGHIALANARFPKGTTGSQLDTIPRYSLWQVGCDYAHGTGHGVGSYLGVHEGPQRISPLPNTVPLREGMILSNEPGYYKQGEYGIRIENLVIVKRVLENQCVDDKPMLCFETITKVPIDMSLINRHLLTDSEVLWLNEYHESVYKILINLVDKTTKKWLKKSTIPFIDYQCFA